MGVEMRQAIEEYLNDIERNLYASVRVDAREEMLESCREHLLDFSHAVGDVEPLMLHREHYNFYAATLDMRGTEKPLRDAKLDDVRRFLGWVERRMSSIKDDGTLRML